MPTAGADRRSRLIVTGFCSISRDSSAIGGGIVALKNSVCRCGGRCRRTRRMSGRKPMSSMRSASSSTRYCEPAELRVRLPEMIEQPARRADDDVDAAAERVLLRSHADAAVDRGRGQRRVHGEVVQVFDDLRRELARRRQDQRARRPARLRRISCVQNRQQEGGGLAAAGHRAGEQVLSGERRRNRVGLNRRRPREAEIFQAPQQASDAVRDG